MMHRNLLFDLDQTLLDFHASEHIALKTIMEMNSQVFTEALYDFFKQINKKLWLEFEKRIISKAELFETRFKSLFEECGCNTNGMDLMKINSDFIDCMSQNGVLMDGALNFLKKVMDSVPNVRIYVITNGATRNAKGRITAAGLNDYICDLFVSESMGVSKPSHEYFDIVKKAINESNKSCIVIGDSLTSDMLGAKNADLTSCWFMPEGDVEGAMKEYEIDYIASSFDDLFDILIKWSAAL
ncbi:MAG: YjjG family noncanonical pyrimidine nucleotidase [Oscillospiraceae bacterium]|nr:YjjG family noncanonical pyrimidine nucleotidase [Oscillospiraceae bacterium]